MIYRFLKKDMWQQGSIGFKCTNLNDFLQKGDDKS
jgi:hypothetical protein